MDCGYLFLGRKANQDEARRFLLEDLGPDCGHTNLECLQEQFREKGTNNTRLFYHKDHQGQHWIGVQLRVLGHGSIDPSTPASITISEAIELTNKLSAIGILMDNSRFYTVWGDAVPN